MMAMPNDSALFNFELPKLVDEEEEEEDPDGLDDLDEASTVNNKTMVVKVTSNAKRRPQ